MSKIRLILLLLVMFLSWAGSLYAQPMTLYFLKGVPQTKDLNPSRPGLEKGFYVSLPLFSKLDLSLNTNNWSFSDLIHPGTGTMADSLVWDFKTENNCGFFSQLAPTRKTATANIKPKWPKWIPDWT